MSVKTPIDKELTKAKTREQVAYRKLDRLKERYDKLKLITDSELMRHAEEQAAIHKHHEDTLIENEELKARCQSLADEAAMWKAQLFDQLDRLDDKQAELTTQQQDFYALQSELAEAQWQLVELVDLERSRAEADLARAQVAIDDLSKELVAEKARVDGLKNLGTCLAAKLERATAQRKVLQREHARLFTLAEQRTELLKAKDDELAEIQNELFEARRQLLSYRIETSSWDGLKESLAQPAASYTQAEATSFESVDPIIDEQPQAGTVANTIAFSCETIEPHPLLVGQSLIKSEHKRRPLKLRAMNDKAGQDNASPQNLFSRASQVISSWLKLEPKR